MLVLSRKVGQEIIVGDSVRITITKVSGNRVTLGVDAPDHVRILRGELAPIACAFDEVEEEEEVPLAVPQAVNLVSDEIDTIPFVPNTAK